MVRSSLKLNDADASIPIIVKMAAVGTVPFHRGIAQAPIAMQLKNYTLV